MNSLLIIASLGCILREVYPDSTRTSRACFGTRSDILPCTHHFLNCSSSKMIAICEAYYTDNKSCGPTGLSHCVNVTLDSVEEDGYHSFNHTEIDDLYETCFSNNPCVYHAPRGVNDHMFSVVKYQCIDDPTVEFFHKSERCQDQSDTDGNANSAVGAAVGGAVVSVLFVVFAVLVVVWYLRKRRQEDDVNDKKLKCQDTEAERKPQPVDISKSHYREIDKSQTNGLSNNYDYATPHDLVSPNTHTYFSIEPITGPHLQQNLAPVSKEDDYDHIGDKPPVQSSNYDTTASVAQSLGTQGHSREDDYGYNRLHEATCTKTVQNDYDTTTSAGKAVAHLERNVDKTLNSPYDTAGNMGGDLSGDYAVAGLMR